MNRKHYHYGSGSHGCLYDNGPHYAAHYTEAVSSLMDTFDIDEADERAEVLRHDGYLELDPHEDGAEYCEIVACVENCKQEDYE